MQKQSPRVFVCYRRDDSRWQASLLADELAARFGQTAVFMDVDNVRPGDWRRQIDDWDLTPCVGHAQSQDVPGGSEMIQRDGKEKLSRRVQA